MVYSLIIFPLKELQYKYLWTKNGTTIMHKNENSNPIYINPIYINDIFILDSLK